MEAVHTRKTGKGAAWKVFWLALLGAAIWYLYDSYVYALTRDFDPGTTFWNRLVWYGAHIVVATPILLIAPLQFVAGIRHARPEVHRWLGRVFLTSSIIAAPLGIYLGATLSNEGSRVPIALLGLLWLLMSVSAWVTARRKDFANHRKFVIRSLALGLAFVWIRILDDFSERALSFIPDKSAIETTQEWLAFVIPLLFVEIWLSWWPAARGRR